MDNNSRLVLFLILSMLILGLSQFLLPTPPVPVDNGANAVSQTTSGPHAAAPQTGAPETLQASPSAHAKKTAKVPAQSVTIETDDYVAVFSNQGAVLTSFQLKKFSNRESKNLVELVNADPKHPQPFSLSYDPIPDLNSRVFEVEGASQKLSKAGDKAGLTFRYVDESGRVLQKEFGFQNGSYLVDFNVTVGQTGGGSTPASSLAVGWADTLGQEEYTGTSSRAGGYRVATLSGGNVDSQTAKKNQEATEIPSPVSWTSLENQFFAAILIPDATTGAASAKVLRDTNAYKPATADNPKAVEDPANFAPRPELVFAGQALKGGESFKRGMKVFVGPQEYKLLQSLGAEKVMDLGTFGFISVYMMDLLRWFFAWIHNWGLAVILLSIAVKLVLWLPTHNSYKNMYLTQQKMREVQPKMDALKRKYPNDPTKQREEQAKLFQEAGINPLGGCLPMFLQLPVFWALYAALNHSIELRGASFLWLKDLTLLDPIYVLPLLMGGTMILQQKVSGQMATQTTGQQKMMMWMMPVVLTFISTKWPAGLLLYWVVTNVLSMIQQKVVNREIQHAKKKVEESKS